jgi:transcriptional regulator with XRE-family HTH domain
MTTTNRAQEDRSRATIARYPDKLMGIPVVLLDAAYEVSHGEEKGVVVPDLKGLEAAIAVARTSVPFKLAGNEIRCLRRAIGEKARDIASFLDLTPEHYSRLENGTGALNTNAEKIFRLRVRHSLHERAKGVKVKDSDILDMTFVPVRPSLEPVTLIFDRLFVLDSEPELVWHFIGIEQSQKSTKGLRVVA